MDPSLSISSDPHHPPSQFNPFPPFSTSNPFVSGAVATPNHPLFGGPNPYNNNHVFQPQTQNPPPPTTQALTLAPPPLFNHPPYSEMICAAIAALNEPDGSSKMAISRYIERFYSGLPPSHGALLTHHLKTLKNSGVLAMVKKSYKFVASSTPPESVAVAAAAAVAAGLEVPRSETHLSTNDTVNDPMLVSASASQPQKRGRGRPPKAKPEAQPQQHQPQPSNVQPSQVQSNGQPNWEQRAELPVTKPSGEVTVSAKRRPGRPRKNGAAGPIVQASVMAGIMKRRGRPPGRRAAGRQRKPKSVSATASVYPYVANGARRRGRPRRIESVSTSSIVAPEGGEAAAVVVPGMKRGRGRPPKIGGVISRLMKPKRGRGRPAGRPRKIVTSATGAKDSGYGELKKKFDLFQEKVKEIANVLKAEATSENQAVVRAIEDLEGLTVMEIVEPQAMEEAAAAEADTQTEAVETQGGKEHEEDRQGGEAQIHTQTEAEAMQEALF